MSLERGATNEAYQWRFNLADLVSAHGQLREASTESVPFKGHTLFLKASESAYIQASHEQEIQRPFLFSQVVTVNRARHWLYNDQLEQFSGAVRAFLLSDAGCKWGS